MSLKTRLERLPTAEEYSLFRVAYSGTYPVRPLMNAIAAKDGEIERLTRIMAAIRDATAPGALYASAAVHNTADGALRGLIEPRPAVETAPTLRLPSNETLRRQIESDPDDDPSAGGGPPTACPCLCHTSSGSGRGICPHCNHVMGD